MKQQLRANLFTVESFEERILFGANLPSTTAISMRYDAGGTLHVAYYNPSAKDLLYATRGPNNVWTPAVKVDASGDVGSQLSLALDPAGRPGIAYYDSSHQDLKFARLVSGRWSVVTVDSAGVVGQNPSLAFRRDGSPIISYYSATTQELRLAVYDSYWQAATIDSVGAVGRFSSVAINPKDGSWAIAYEAAGSGQLRFVQQSTGSPKSSAIVAVGGLNTSACEPALVFDTAGNALVTYVNPATRRLVLAQLASGQSAPWTTSVIASGLGTSTDNSLNIDPQSGQPLVVYMPGAGRVAVAYRGAAGWASGEIGAGLTVASAVDSGTSDMAVISPTQVLRLSTHLDAPSQLLASATSNVQVDLTWVDDSTDDTGFAIERSTDGGPFMGLATPAANARSFADHSVSPGRDYDYRVFALHGNARSIDSASGSATTPADATAPTPNPSTWATAPYATSTTSISMTATTASDPSGVQYFFHCLTAGGHDSGWRTSATYQDTGLAPSTTYTYQVMTRDRSVDQNQGSYSATAGATTNSDAPTNLVASVVGPNVRLSWTDNSNAETGYIVQRSPNGTTWTTLQTTSANATEYTDATASAGNQYRYRVLAQRPIGYSDPSNIQVVPSDGAPQTPTIGAATAVSETEVDVSWTLAGSGETSVVVWRSGDGGTTWLSQATLPARTTSYQDVNCLPGTEYRYRIAAVNGMGSSLASGETMAKTADAAVAPIFSEQWRENWRTALADVNSPFHPWAQLLIHDANLTGIPGGQTFDDNGDRATYAYLLTGDATYADKAWGVIASGLDQSQATDKNFQREYLTRNVLLYYGLKLGGYWELHPDRRQQYANMLNAVADQTIIALRFTDSDQTVGALGVTLWGLVSQGENTKASGYLSNPSLGGLTVTNSQPNTVRNAVADYCRKAAGGQWIESSAYNLGTVRLLIMATEGIRAVTGQDYFPDAKAFYQDAAMSEMAIITPDLKQPFQWGDVQNPRQLTLWYRTEMLGMLAGVTQDDPSVGPYIQHFVRDLADQYGWTGYMSAEPWGTMFFTFNPIAPEADWRSLPQFAAPSGGVAVADASGRGFTFIREGANTDAAFAGLMSYTPSGVDHDLPVASDFQLYSNGEWAFTHPLGYMTNAYSYNTILSAGLGVLPDAGRIAYEVGEKGSYVYTAESTGGSTAWYDYWNPPPAFIQEMTRSMLYLPSTDGSGRQTLVLFDRMNVDQPQATDYNPIDWQSMASHPLKELTFHSPVLPTIQQASTGVTLSWATAGGQKAQVELLSSGLATNVIQDDAGLIGGYSFPEEQAGYVTCVTPATYSKWNTSLSVVQVGSTVDTTERLVSADGTVEGVTLHRTTARDVVVLFNAQQAADLPPVKTVNDRRVYDPKVMTCLQAAHIRHTGFAVDVHTTAAIGEVHVADLDPTQQWTVAIDGTSPAPLAVSTAGLSTFTINNAGHHTILVAPAQG